MSADIIIEVPPVVTVANSGGAPVKSGVNDSPVARPLKSEKQLRKELDNTRKKYLKLVQKVRERRDAL